MINQRAFFAFADGVSAGELPGDDEHYIICEKCGQAVDCNNLMAVLHHGADDHKPMRLDS